MRGTSFLLVLILGCGGPDPVEPGSTEAGPEETADGNTDTYTVTHPSVTPTDVDAECWSWATSDQSEDGSIESTTLEIYDPTTLATLHYGWDDGPDGDLDYVSDYTYDGGVLTTSSIDEDGDGTYEEVTVRVRDAAGLLVSLTVDYGGDGSLDEVWTYLYDGELLGSIEVDEGDDGTVDLRYTYTRDSEDRTTSIDGDRGDDGTFDLRYTYTYFDPTGPDVTTELDEDLDGEPELVWTYLYDDQLRIVDYEYWDSDENEYLYSYTYNADSDIETIAGTVYAEGQWYYDFVYSYTWLAPKKLASSLFEADLYGDGAFSYTVLDSYTWFCP